MYPVISSDMLAGAFEMATCFFTLVAALVGCLFTSRA